jgi:hypothetical protein
LEQAAFNASTRSSISVPWRFQPIFILAVWLIVGWLLLLAARFLLEYSFTQVANNLLGTSTLGVAIGLSLAQLYSLATLASQLRYRPQGSAIAAVVILITFTIIIVGAIFPPDKIAGCWIHSCVNIITYFLVLGVFLLPSNSFLRNASPSIGRLCIKDLLLATFVMAVFFSVVRLDGGRIYQSVSNDIGMLARDYRLLVAAFAISLVQAMQGIATLYCITANRSILWTSCVIIVICFSATLTAAVVILVNTTIFGAYRWDMPWFIEILKTQFPWHFTFAIWFTASIRVFQSIGLLPSRASKLPEAPNIAS